MYFFFDGSYPVRPYPSKGAEPGSLLNSEIIQSPPQHMWLVSTPFETCGGVPGAPIEIWTLASQVPSESASVACSAVGLAGSCAIAQSPPATSAATAPSAARRERSRWLMPSPPDDGPSIPAQFSRITSPRRPRLLPRAGGTHGGVPAHIPSPRARASRSSARNSSILANGYLR